MKIAKPAIVVFSVAFIIVVVDQLTKWFISHSLTLHQSIPIIQSIFHITYVTNFGAGFSIFQNQRWLLVFISVIVVGIILFYLDGIKEDEQWLQIVVGAILGGTVGNLIDRLAFGYVIDFLDFRIWPVFNVADSLITIGILSLVFYMWRK